MPDFDSDPLAAMLGEHTAIVTGPAPMASTNDLADLIGVSARAVTDLGRRGILERSAVGAWPVRESIRSYCAHLREQAAGRTGSTTLTEERVRVAREQAEKLVMANAVTRGEMVPARQVQSEWASVLRDVRAALMAVASRCGATLPHLTGHDVATVDGEIRSALEALADGN